MCDAGDTILTGGTDSPSGASVLAVDRSRFSPDSAVAVPVSAPHETPGQPETRDNLFSLVDAMAAQYPKAAQQVRDMVNRLATHHAFDRDTKEGLAEALVMAEGRCLDLEAEVHRLEGEREEGRKPATGEWLRELHGMSDAELFGWLDLARARMEPADAAAVDQIRFRFCAAITNAAARLTPQDTTDANTALSADRV